MLVSRRWCVGLERQIFITLCVYLGQIIAGYLITWTAPAIPKLQDLNQSPISRLLSDVELSLLASIVYVGGIFAVTIMSWLSNYKGRKLCFLIASAANCISYVLLLLTKTYPVLLTSRFLCAVGATTSAFINVVYIGEIASTKIRGILLTGLGISLTLGSILLLSVGPYVSFSTINYIGLTLSIVYFLAVLSIPESPMFYVIKDDTKELTKVLQKLGRESEIEDIIKLKSDKLQNIREDWRDLFMTKCNRKGLIIALVINILQYGSGGLIVLFFVTSIFEMAGSSVDPNIASIIVGCTQLTGSVISPFFVERSGRRLLLLVSTAFCCASMVIFGIYFYLVHIDAGVVDYIKWLPLAMLIVFFLSNNMGFGIIPTTLSGEMFKANVRSKGIALIVVTSYIVGFTLTTFFNSIVSIFGAHIMFWFFSFTCGVAFIFTLLVVPETKGKSLAEITDMLSK